MNKIFDLQNPQWNVENILLGSNSNHVAFLRYRIGSFRKILNRTLEEELNLFKAFLELEKELNK